MKHDIKITLILVFIFLLSQIIGLFFVANDINQINYIGDELVVEHQNTALGERPQVTGSNSVIYTSIIILLGTIIFLILAKFKAKKIWKGWYFVAVIMAMTIALGVFINNALIAFLISLLLALLKIFKPDVIIHNLTEILMYTGVAVIFVPLFDLFWISVFLILISIYDMYAVWKSKHMITMAKFASETELFAGLNINYNKNGKIVKPSKKGKKIKIKRAILGGGDVVFPLFFSGVAMEHLLKLGYSLGVAFSLTMIIVLFSTLSLYTLFYFSKKGKFYPAMPFLSSGCFVGLGFMSIFTLLLF